MSRLQLPIHYLIDEGFIVTNARCVDCGHRGVVAINPLSPTVELLECPACHHMSYVLSKPHEDA